jgi:hypothetical protein
MEQIREIAMTIVSVIGGVGGGLTLLGILTKLFSTLKTLKASVQQTKATQENTSTLNGGFEALAKNIVEKLTGGLDVDISGKLDDISSTFIAEVKKDVVMVLQENSAITRMLVDLLTMLAQSPSRTAEERETILAGVNAAKALIEPKTENIKPKLLLSLGANSDTSAKSTVKEQKVFA